MVAEATAPRRENVPWHILFSLAIMPEGKTAIDVLLYADAGFDSGIQFRNHANVLQPENEGGFL